MGLLATEPIGEHYADWPLLLNRAARDLARVHNLANFSHLGSGEQFIRVGLDFGVQVAVGTSTFRLVCIG
jgi:hypothetical protein